MQKRLFNINGVNRTVVVDPKATLADVLRKQLGLTGTKVGCEQGQCGACSVLVDGKVVRSCVTQISRVADEAKIVTIEGIGTAQNLHPLQLAFMVHGVTQCGFCNPGFIVSAKGLLDQNASPTREEVRDWFSAHRNACRCTGYIPITDAVMDAAKVLRGEMTMDDLSFKIPADGRIWGSRAPRPTGLAKVTGTCDYGDDLNLQLPEGALRLALVQAEVSHANILGIDTSEAEKMPGVFKILTYKDVKGTNRMGMGPQATNKGDGQERPMLNDTKVFMYGDALAIVCADTEANARAAAAKVKVDLEPLPPYLNALDAMADDAIEIHPGTPNVYFEIPIIKGQETKPLMDSAPYVAEGSYYLQRQPHLTIEPDVGFAYIDEEGRLTIQTKSINLWMNHGMLFKGLGVAPEKLRLVGNPAGGTFGYKMCITNEAVLGIAALATGRPVSIRFNMKQHITWTGKRSPFWIDLKMAADKNGKLVAMESDWSVDHGPYSDIGDLLTIRGSQFIGSGYGIPNIRGTGRTVCTNHGYGSPFRAYGSPQSFLASESLMDELAEKIGMDPLEFRYLNVYRPGDTTPVGQTPEVFTFPEMIDILRPKYKAALAKAEAESTPQIRKGVGVSLGIYGCGLDGVDGAEVWVELNKEGVTVGNSWEDHGQGSDAGTVGTAHEALRPLGTKPEQIKLVMNDTAFVPDAGPAGGSRSQVMVGNAIINGCENLIKAMRKPDGSFRTYDEMVAEKIPLRYAGKYAAAGCVPCDLTTSQGKPFSIYMYGLFMSEVAVDIATGRTTVEKVTAVSDIGKINNRATVDGQMWGGIAQGIGLAISEDFDDLERHITLAHCGLPYSKDIPDNIELIYVETPRATGPFGAAGVGEMPLTSPHVSIINAIHHACGVRIRHLPALPEKVLAGLKELEKR
jgi:aldehyde oxidoreductase